MKAAKQCKHSLFWGIKGAEANETDKRLLSRLLKFTSCFFFLDWKGTYNHAR